MHRMAEPAPNTDEEDPPKKGKGGLLIGLVLALAMGGGGFFAGSTGLLSSTGSEPAESEDTEAMQPSTKEKVAFVEIEPVLIALARESSRKHLRFRGHIEVNGDYQEEVQEMMPRILDVLNSYLRAVEVRQLEDPSGLLRLRAQMLRRIQVVSGEGRVKDLLISEFVLN